MTRNNTNLAVKGMIGIEAMAVIANKTGHPDDGANFTMIAHDYINKWENELAVNYDATPPHVKEEYHNANSYGRHPPQSSAQFPATPAQRTPSS